MLGADGVGTVGVGVVGVVGADGVGVVVGGPAGGVDVVGGVGRGDRGGPLCRMGPPGPVGRGGVAVTVAVADVGDGALVGAGDVVVGWSAGGAEVVGVPVASLGGAVVPPGVPVGGIVGAGPRSGTSPSVTAEIPPPSPSPPGEPASGGATA